MSPIERFADFNLAFQGMLYPMEIDHMGHANVRYYSRAFNEAAYFTFTTAGITPAFMRANDRGMAAVTENFLYRREILPGDLVSVRTCFIDFTEKSLHVWGVMIDPISDEVCAVNDQICVHLDTIARKAVPWPKDIYDRGKSLVRERPEV
jgi:acyl-CoA thioester hydrolase